MEHILSRNSLFRRPPPILAASASAALSVLAVFLWPRIVAIELPSLRTVGRFLLPHAPPEVLYEAIIWLSYVVIAVILTSVILRSRLDALTRWMCFTFFALVTTCGFARLIRGGLFSPAPHWLMNDLLIVAAFSSITTAMAVTWITIAHKMAHPNTAEYFANSTLRDAVTELPTLLSLQKRLTRDIRKTPHHGFSVLLLDLDQFKRVNQTLGHQAGNELMAQVAQRLCRNLRRADICARIGADEFAIYLRHAKDSRTAMAIARELQIALAGVMRVDGHELAVTASIGVSVYPESGETATTLLRNAETAMYQAKLPGNNSSVLFTREMAAIAGKKVSMERALRHALDRGEFSLQYQPQISLETGAVTGVEALLRWNSADFGLVSPLDFLPLAEEIHVISPITDWVMAEACRYVVALNADREEPLTLAVNFSPSQLQRDELAAAVARTLAITGLSGDLLEVEITENALMDNSAKTMATLASIRALGVRIAIDDFGTGFSSMAYILRFNIDRLKIDRSFIRDSGTSVHSAVVTVSIISLAHALGIKVIAEGVETMEQVSMLAEAGCDDVQGYLFSRPVPPENLRSVLAVHELSAHRNRMREMMTRNV
jgi:diguanylate cyclase (GGDEF)-like protein